jgi:hypothetical protein
MESRERLVVSQPRFQASHLLPVKVIRNRPTDAMLAEIFEAYRSEEPRTPWNKCTAVRSPYIRGKLTYKAEFKDGSVSISVIPDDPALIDRHPDYTTETDLGDRPPTPIQQRDENSKRKANKKKTNLSAIPDKVSRT